MKKLLLSLCLLSSGILAQNWLPLRIGNCWDYYVYQNSIGGIGVPSSEGGYIARTRVLDTMSINNKVYYNIRNFPPFLGDLWFRYDENSQKIYIRQNNTDHLFMNFNLVGGNFFQQYYLNGNYRNVMFVESLYDTTNFLFQKGYSVYPSNVENYNLFYPNIGFYRTFEISNLAGVNQTNRTLIEYLLITSNNDTIHYKHNNKVQIFFNPIRFLPNLPKLQDSIKVRHVYNGFIRLIYIDSVFFEYYYSNGNISTTKSRILLPPLQRVDFNGLFRTILNFEIDTVKYQNGYYLYYRIGAKDSGIVPTYSFVPDTGYIKLYWRDSTSSVDNEEMPVTNFYLHQNHPNPFNPSTTISWQSPVGSWQTIKLYDLLGREIETIVEGYYEAGSHSTLYIVNSTLPSGVYFYQLRAGNYIQTKKMILLR